MSEFDHDVLPLDITQVAEAATDRCHLWVILAVKQHTETWNVFGQCHEGHCCRGTHERDEFAPPHSHSCSSAEDYSSSSRPCPLWVISRHLQRKIACPLYPRKRTFALHWPLSAKGQKR